MNIRILCIFLIYHIKIVKSSKQECNEHFEGFYLEDSYNRHVPPEDPLTIFDLQHVRDIVKVCFLIFVINSFSYYSLTSLYQLWIWNDFLGWRLETINNPFYVPILSLEWFTNIYQWKSPLLGSKWKGVQIKDDWFICWKMSMDSQILIFKCDRIGFMAFYSNRASWPTYGCFPVPGWTSWGCNG